MSKYYTIPIVMIIGAPRSGTTILGRVLDQHPRISTLVEPYYIWDHYFREAPHDQKTADDATDEIQTWIHNAFAKFLRAQKVDVVVDKSPRNSLKIPFVRKIFPEARFIFIFRDGRDTILSIFNQWEWNRKIFADKETGNQWPNRLRVFMRWLGRRPTWQCRLQSIRFELGPPRNWIKKKFLNQIRWEGRFGWGPRFEGWQEIIDRTTPLEFSTYQWIHCARGILDNINLISEDRRILIRYEDFIRDPRASLEILFNFLDLKFPEGFMDRIPAIRANNTGQWRHAFSSADLKKMGRFIGKTLIEFGYEKDESWYQGTENK